MIGPWASITSLLPVHLSVQWPHFRLLTAKTFAGVTDAAAILLRRSYLRQLISTATSASAAQPQFDDYECYCYDYRAERKPRVDRLAAAYTEDSEGSVRRQNFSLVFIGSPQTKKHLYAEKLLKLLINSTSYFRGQIGSPTT